MKSHNCYGFLQSSLQFPIFVIIFHNFHENSQNSSCFPFDIEIQKFCEVVIFHTSAGCSWEFLITSMWMRILLCLHTSSYFNKHDLKSRIHSKALAVESFLSSKTSCSIIGKYFRLKCLLSLFLFTVPELTIRNSVFRIILVCQHLTLLQNDFKYR